MKEKKCGTKEGYEVQETAVMSCPVKNKRVI